MAVKSLRAASTMDHTFYGVPVHSMNEEQLAEARAKGLDEKIIQLYHGEPEDPFKGIFAGVSAKAEEIVRSNYGSQKTLAADLESGHILTVKGIGQKTAKTLAKNLSLD